MRSRGKLYVVGIGPGKEDLLTLRAKKALGEAEVVLGHRTYVRRVIDAISPEAEVIESQMGKEVERVKLAVELSKSRKVCLVSGGDPSVYGMASLVVEYVLKNKIEVNMEIIPGVTALSAASPLLGCPVSGDHCVISLSDLLTPWEVIERRLVSAVLGDFVIVIYNPSSKRRRNNLVRAMEVIQRLRGDVAVGCVRNAEREKTEVWITKPSEIIKNPERVDMHTILFVSSHETLSLNNKLLTPRGYSRKYAICTNDKAVKASGAKTRDGVEIAKSSAKIAGELIQNGDLRSFVAERCLVATADPSFVGLLRFNREEEVLEAARKCDFVVDVEMVKAGIRAKNVLVASKAGDASGKTVTASGIRKLDVRGKFVAIGNAPSALEELCRLIDEGIEPSAVVATPVGFTNAARSKEELMKRDLPWIVVAGARGGSTLCVAIVNALLAY